MKEERRGPYDGGPQGLGRCSLAACSIEEDCAVSARDPELPQEHRAEDFLRQGKVRVRGAGGVVAL